MKNSKAKKTNTESARMPENAETKHETESASDRTPETEPVAAESALRADQAAEIGELRNKVADLESKRLCALAEMDNQRKRFAKEMENLRNHVANDTLFPFLQVFDHFKMAVDAAKNSDNGDSIRKGMEIIQNEFEKALKNLSVEQIDALGKPFDPNLHEAMAEEPSETVPAGSVVKQWCMGYRRNGVLIKPAMVVVSAGSPDAPSANT